jgi:predicted nucleotidyltransferase component of viral defense system
MRPLVSTRAGFAAGTVHKVERLLEVLAALREDPLLGAAFVLHGGTALNMIADDMPRLSVDLDLMYLGQVGVAEMQVQRPRVRETHGDIVPASTATVRVSGICGPQNPCPACE